MAEADAPHGLDADELADGVDDVGQRGGIAGPVGEEDGVGVLGEQLLRAARARVKRHARAAREQLAHHRGLDAVLRISSVRAVIALGVGGILITRGPSSAGRTVGLAAVISGSLAQRMNYPSRLFPNMADHSIWIPVLAGIGAGLLVGLLNGTIVAFLKVPAFIATLGTMTIVYGAESLYVDRPPMGATPLGGFKDRVHQSRSGSIGPDSFSVPIIIIIAIVISLFIFLILNKTRLGKNIYAMGGNPDAAVVSGVSIWKNTMLVYAIAGLLYGLGGVLLAARAGGATNNYGQGYELDAIAACVIGGVSVSGASAGSAACWSASSSRKS